MNKAKELDILVAANAVSRSISEIVFCSIHPEMTGPNRIHNAHQAFGEAILCLIKAAK